MTRRRLPLGAWPPLRPWWRQPAEWLWLPLYAAAEAVTAWERAGLPMIRRRPKETNMTNSRTWTGPVNPCTNGESFCGQHGYRCPDEEPSRLSLYRKIVGAPPPPADWTCPADDDTPETTP